MPLLIQIPHVAKGTAWKSGITINGKSFDPSIHWKSPVNWETKVRVAEATSHLEGNTPYPAWKKKRLDDSPLGFIWNRRDGKDRTRFHEYKGQIFKTWAVTESDCVGE